jgi:hypothetical protein
VHVASVQRIFKVVSHHQKKKTEKRVIDTKAAKAKTINKGKQTAEKPMSVVEQSRRGTKKQNCPTRRCVYVASRKQKITKGG